MAKPTPTETSDGYVSASPAPLPGELEQLAAGAVTDVAAPTVIRAEPGKPWPDAPHGGRWSRDPATGDLTLIEVQQYPTTEERTARKAAAQAAQAKTHPKE